MTGDPHDHDREDQDEPAEPEPEDQPGPEPDHARPDLSAQLAALATVRLILTGASPDVVHAAAASAPCPVCTALAGVSFVINLAATLAGEKLGVSPELVRVMLAAVDAAEAELRGMSN